MKRYYVSFGLIMLALSAVQAVDASATLSKKEIAREVQRFSKTCRDRFGVLSRAKQQTVLVKFAKSKKELSEAYKTSIVGGHAWYLECSYLMAGIQFSCLLSLMVLGMVYMIDGFKIEMQDASSVFYVDKLKFTLVSLLMVYFVCLVTTWLTLPSQVRRVNERLFWRELLKVEQKGVSYEDIGVEEMAFVPKRCLASFSAMSKPARERVMVMFNSRKKSLFLGKFLALVGLHPLYVGCSYIGGGLMFVIVLNWLAFMWNCRAGGLDSAVFNLKDHPHTVECTIFGYILFIVTLWTTSHMGIEKAIEEENEKIFEACLAQEKKRV